MSAQDQYVNDNEEAFRLAMDGRLSTLWTSMPGMVVDVNFSEMTCSVQPLIQGIVTDESGAETPVSLPKLIHCPIIFPQAGGFALTLPLAAGDEVLICWASRAVDAWWQQGGIQPPVETRMHDISDGFVIPGPCSQPNTIPNISSTAAQLRTKDGSTVLQIGSDGKITMTATEVDITGNLKVTGTIVATGQVTGNGIPLSTHLHGGVTTGAGNTGVPHT